MIGECGDESLAKPAGDANNTKTSQFGFSLAADSIAHACLQYNLLFYQRNSDSLTAISTYRAFKRTRWSSKQEVSWKNIFLPFPGRFSAAMTSSRNSTVWAASNSALSVCRKHFFALFVRSNDQTIKISTTTANASSARNRKLWRK